MCSGKANCGFGLRAALFVVTLFLISAGCGGGGPQSDLTVFTLSDNAKGSIETVDHILNMTIVSKDENVL